MSRKSSMKSIVPRKLPPSEYEKQASINNPIEQVNFFNTFDYVVITIITLASIFFMLRHIESISWQLSSIGRIFLIKLLPFYDWKHLKNERCLIDSWEKSPTENAVFNCDVCETIESIDVFATLDEDILEERYIDLDVPVILTSGLESCPKDAAFIEALKTDEYFSATYPCKVSTNIFKGSGSAADILERTRRFDKFFLSFQNCELEATRVLRRHCYRPDNFPPKFSPTVHNWLVWNKNYNTTFYRPIDLVENVAIFGQLFGSTSLRLIPRRNCESVCPILNIEVVGGEMLIFSDLWDLEYRTPENGENMAIIMELRG